MAKSRNVFGPVLGLALLVAGGLLIWWGYSESQAFVNQLAEAVGGAQPDRVMWKYIGGAVCAVVGLGLLARR